MVESHTTGIMLWVREYRTLGTAVTKHACKQHYKLIANVNHKCGIVHHACGARTSHQNMNCCTGAIYQLSF